MTRTDIAIIGMAGRFPGASDIAQFWADLLAGRENVRDLHIDELTAAGITDAMIAGPAYVARAADLADASCFDASFFGISPQEARITDPQHRIFLECAWAATEDAGLVPAGLEGNVGVWASSSMSSYLVNQLRDGTSAEVRYPVLIGNDKDFVASRVAYKMDLHGPAVGVQTACSSSLVAVHLAAQALRAGDCDAALAGGVSITFPQHAGYEYKDGGILSADGRCRPFDAGSSGTIKGNGCAVVVLMRLEDALVGRYPIYAVLRGSAIGNDGAQRAGFTAPSPRGQSRTIKAALEQAALPPSAVGFIEAHGTGTALGDPIELRALTREYDEVAPGERRFIGSVKANVGHLDAAAGVTGLIKTALVLRHQTVPPQINFDRLNPAIHLDDHWLVPRTAIRPDEPISAAAVSSFGLGGSNAHCVLAAPPARPRPQAAPGTEPLLIALSARDVAGLQRTAERLLHHLAEHPEVQLADLSYTLLHGRIRLSERLVFLARDLLDVRKALAAFLRDGVRPDPAPSAEAWLKIGTAPPPEAHAMRISLPGYDFDRVEHWIQAPVPSSAPAASMPSPAADDNIADVVSGIMRKHLGVVQLSSDEDFYEVGGDSLTAVEIVADLRERLATDIALQQFEKLRTVNAVTNFVREARHGVEITPALASHAGVSSAATSHRQKPAGASAEPLRGGTGTPVFFFPPAGGTNFCYYRLARHLEGGQPLYAMTFPVDRLDQVRTVRALAEQFLDAIRAVQPHGPYRLAGYSFGGNVAFQVALLLQDLGQKVTDLVMFDAHPPEAYLSGDRLSDQDLLTAFPMLLSQVFGIRREPGAGIPANIEEALQMLRLPGSAAEVLGEYRRFLQVWAHNHGALKRWYPDDYFEGNVTIFEAGDAEDADLLAQLRIRRLDKQPWAAHITGTLRLRSVPGDHYSMFADPVNLRALAAAWNATVTDD